MTLGAVTALAGCGDSGSEPSTSSDREQIEAAMTSYLDAVADGDGDKACGHLAAGAQKDLATLAGGSSCPDAVEQMSEALDGKSREQLRSGRIDRVVIDGTTAKATVASGDTIPLEKSGDAWKVTEFASGGGYSNTQQAQCVTGGMDQFDEGGGDPFWQREGREDFHDYIVEVCRRADRRGLLDGSRPGEALKRVAGNVILEMVDRGQIRDPR